MELYHILIIILLVVGISIAWDIVENFKIFVKTVANNVKRIIKKVVITGITAVLLYALYIFVIIPYVLSGTVE